MSASPWAAVLFDLDGTLADTVELILHCFRHAFQVHRGRVPADAELLVGIGKPLRDQLRDFGLGPEEVESMAETYATLQRRIHDDMVAPYPGAVALVRDLRAEGAGVAVVTSKRRGMAERTLERCGFQGLVDVLVGADDVTRGKPDPEPVRLALDQLGLARDAGRTLFVGDSPWDMRAGRAGGTRTAGALWGPFGREALTAEAPDWLVEEPGAVLTLRP